MVQKKILIFSNTKIKNLNLKRKMQLKLILKKFQKNSNKIITNYINI